jgi:glutathione S-transferase
MAPVTLYGMTMSWNVTRCVAALEEAGIEYDVVPIDFGAGEHKSPDHLARNVRIYTLSPPRTPPYLLSTCF